MIHQPNNVIRFDFWCDPNIVESVILQLSAEYIRCALHIPYHLRHANPLVVTPPRHFLFRTPSHFSMLTWNTHGLGNPFSPRRDIILNTIDSSAPIFVALQETNQTSADQIWHPPGYSSFSSLANPGIPGQRGVSLWIAKIPGLTIKKTSPCSPHFSCPRTLRNLLPLHPHPLDCWINLSSLNSCRETTYLSSNPQ